MKLLLSLLIFTTVAIADDVDTRYCREQPLRDADGSISRDMGEIAKFKRIHSCPSNGHNEGACPGWNIDHVIPLANGGCDTVINMQWLPIEIKRCGGNFCKDRWERTVYKRQPSGYNTSNTIQKD